MSLFSQFNLYNPSCLIKSREIFADLDSDDPEPALSADLSGPDPANIAYSTGPDPDPQHSIYTKYHRYIAVLSTACYL